MIKKILLAVMLCPLLLSCGTDNKFSKMQQEFLKTAPHGSQVEFKTGIGYDQDKMVAIVYTQYEVHAYILWFDGDKLQGMSIPFYKA